MLCIHVNEHGPPCEMEARHVRWRGFKDKDGDDGLLDRRNYSGHMELSERQIFFSFFFLRCSFFFNSACCVSTLDSSHSRPEYNSALSIVEMFGRRKRQEVIC